MAEVLSQSEIDSLLSAVSSGAVATGADGADQSAHADWIAYDLTSQEKIFRGRFSGLEGIHDRLSRLLRMSLGRLLKKNVTVSCLSTEYLRFGDYCANILLPASFNILEMKNVKGSLILLATSKLTYVLVESYYGGSERAYAKLGSKADFTPVENMMVRKLVGSVVEELGPAWRLNYPLSVEFLRSESNPAFVGAIHGSELVVVATFEVELDKLSGPFQLILPIRPLETIQKQLSVNMTAEIDGNAECWSGHWHEELMTLPLGLSVELGSTDSSLRQIDSWKPGQKLMLNSDAVRPLPISVELVPKLVGLMGEANGNIAVKIVGDLAQQVVRKAA